MPSLVKFDRIIFLFVTFSQNRIQMFSENKDCREQFVWKRKFTLTHDELRDQRNSSKGFKNSSTHIPQIDKDISDRCLFETDLCELILQIIHNWHLEILYRTPPRSR